MIHDHPAYGPFDVKLDCRPTITVNHRVGMQAARWHAHGVETSLREIAEYKGFSATSQNKHTINGVSYTLHAMISPNLPPERRVFWSCGMTDSAKKKFDPDRRLTVELLAFVIEHEAELRAEVAEQYRASVAEVVAALRDNAEAMEQAAGLLPQPKTPAMRHAVFIASLMNNMRDTLLSQVERMPENWDGFELRELVKDYVSDQAVCGSGMTPTRRKQYRNEVIVRNLG